MCIRDRSDTADLAGLLFRGRSFSHSKLGIFLFSYFPVPRFPVPRFLLPRYQRPLNTHHCIYMSLQKLGNERLTHYDCGIVRKACIFTVKSSAPAAQRRSQVKWLTPVKPEKNACPASALFQCSLIRFDAADAADHKATPPPPMKNARRAAAAGHKTTHRRRRPPVRRRTALPTSLRGRCL